MNDTSSQVAKRHHTVPKFYLRGFAREDQIATIRLPGDQRFLQSVNDAALEKHFYTVDGHEEGADVVERALAEVEGRSATIFEKVIAGSWPLDLEDRSALGYFIALQATRVPALRKTMDYVGAQMLRLQIGASGKAALRSQLEDQGREVSDELLEDLWAQRPDSRDLPSNRRTLNTFNIWPGCPTNLSSTSSAVLGPSSDLRNARS